MKSYGVTIQMKPLQQYFHMVLFIYYVVVTFESVDEILWCGPSNKTSFMVVLSHDAICFSKFYKFNEILNFCPFLPWSLLGVKRFNSTFVYKGGRI